MWNNILLDLWASHTNYGLLSREGSADIQTKHHGEQKDLVDRCALPWVDRFHPRERTTMETMLCSNFPNTSQRLLRCAPYVWRHQTSRTMLQICVNMEDKRFMSSSLHRKNEEGRLEQRAAATVISWRWLSSILSSAPLLILNTTSFMSAFDHCCGIQRILPTKSTKISECPRKLLC